ncbi:hypothetical protein JGS22_007340 [Streptomyces sp. P38-E01]|uniref:Uncharacterized protein n=1 Tax=Streptomyces tardus TaxID=2780544 RepID=A0A949JNN3_9ACTN|nr:hypothetical protein [Streptomyces tardus]MBU7597445.1 hypothetical protein [Streptomyces tardus]
MNESHPGLEGARRIRKPKAQQTAPGEINDGIEQCELQRSARRAATPGITYPEQLRVSQEQDHSLPAICDRQVVIIAGEAARVRRPGF